MISRLLRGNLDNYAVRRIQDGVFHLGCAVPAKPPQSTQIFPTALIRPVEARWSPLENRISFFAFALQGHQ
jgi:hypothetical protein